jgi:lysyl-tRNA synthetase class I
MTEENNEEAMKVYRQIDYLRDIQREALICLINDDYDGLQRQIDKVEDLEEVAKRGLIK